MATSWSGLVLAVVLGLLWGSFANVCIYRWPPSDEHPKGRSVVKPDSHCVSCLKAIRWYDNIPVLSYLWLRGKCRDCGTQFSARYILVEALTGILFATVWWFAVDARATLDPLDVRVIRAGIGAAFAFVMVVILFIDLDHMLILDRVTLPSIVAFYALGIVLPERGWQEGIIGAAVGFALVRVVADLFLLLRGKIGMGMGDGKLLAVVGALLGWKGPVVALFLGACVAVIVVVPAMLIRGAGSKDDGAADAADDDGEPPPPLPWAERKLALWSLAFVAAVVGGVMAGLPPWIGGAIIVAGAMADDFFGLTDPMASPESDEAVETDGDDQLTHGALPFGPFLAVAALFWWFAEPYVMFQLRQ